MRRTAVTAFLDSIGYGAIDTGPLAEEWRQQPGMPAYGSFDDETRTPVDAGSVRAALASARR
jgi:predicted dinucleotide-binding enzyme